MNRFAIAVVAVGLALSSGLGSQGRPEFLRLDPPAGSTQGLAPINQSPGLLYSSFEVKSTEKMTVLEEHYRKQLVAYGWRLEATGGDTNGAFSRFAIPANAQAGTLLVTPIETGRARVQLRAIQSMEVPPPLAPKTEAGMMDWMLRQLPRQLPGEAPATAASELPGTFPSELLPARFKRSRVLAAPKRVTVAGTLDNTTPADISMFFVGLRKAGWISSPRLGFAEVFASGEFCRNDTRASFVFNVEPNRVVMAAISADTPPDLGCQFRAGRSPGYFFPIVVVPSAWIPAQLGGGGGETRFESHVRLNTTVPVATLAAGFESQIVAWGYKPVSRAGDTKQSYVRFESTPAVGASAVVILSLTRLPWSPQVDAVIDAVGLSVAPAPRR